MGTFYDAPNDYRNYLAHHGVKGMHWGIRKQYPIVGRPRDGGLRRISRNPLISALQTSNARRNQAKYNKETSDFDTKNKELKSKLTKLRDDRFNYVDNKWNSYGKDKKFTSAMNKWISDYTKHFESRTGKSGAELKRHMMDSVAQKYGDDRDQSGFEYIQDYLYTNDKSFRSLSDELGAMEEEYRQKRLTYGRHKPVGIIY